jgi:hypothetical protein
LLAFAGSMIVVTGPSGVYLSSSLAASAPHLTQMAFR